MRYDLNPEGLVAAGKADADGAIIAPATTKAPNRFKNESKFPRRGFKAYFKNYV